MLNEKEKKVIALIDQDASHSNYFFNRVKDLKWFYPLKERGFFLPERIPLSERGDFLFWNILDYLERVSEHVAKNQKFGKELIEIINNIVRFSQNKKRINNEYIWWYCVKILNNIPSNIITENLNTDKFNLWLSAWTENSMGSNLTIVDISGKLLLKFLSDDTTIEYAEAIIDTITRIKPGGKISALTRKDDAVLYWDSFWIKDAFSRHHNLIGQKCSIKAVSGIADKLKKVLEYKQKTNYVNIELGSDVYRIDVSRCPAEGIKGDEIEFINSQYECVVRQFSQDQLKDVDRQVDSFALHYIEPQNELKRFVFNSKSRDAFIAAIKNDLPSEIKWTTAEEFEKKIGYIFDGLYSDYSQIWCTSLVVGSEHGRDAEEVLVVILRDVLLAKCESNRQEGKQIVDAFLGDGYLFPIFRRFVLLCVDKFWPDYEDLLSRFFDLIPDALQESEFEVELQDVLLHHNFEFSEPFKAKLKELINNVPEYYVEKGEKQTDYWKYKWLSPLRDNSSFSALYEEAKKKAKPKDGKPYEPERSAIRGGWVDHKSPISKEDILRKPVAELVKYLNEFKEVDFWHKAFEGEPDKEGLSDALQAAVKDKPEKFTDEINALYGVNYFYLHRVFRGLKESWSAGKELDWERIFNFALKYFGRGKDSILNEALQAQGEDSGEGKYIWIVQDIIDLIADGSRNDSRAFDPKYFNVVEQIFDLVFPLLKGERHPDTQRDALTYALNTTLGRTIMGYVSFSLRVARATQKRPENWGPHKYERFFNIGIDAYIWFGCYLPQMKYLDEKYTGEKIEFFAQKPPDDFEWQMFMEGYLTEARVYKDVYRLMRPNYLKGLENKVFDERVDQRLVEHVCIGYLHFDELLQPKNSDGQDSLFWKMLTEAGALDKRGRWQEVTGFFWSNTGRTIKKEDYLHWKRCKPTSSRKSMRG